MVSPINCIHCQASLSRADARFCPVCGKPQTSAASQPDPDASSSGGDAPSPPSPSPTATIGVGAFLLIQEGGRSESVSLGQQPLTLGRSAENDIVIPSRFVSGRHARIEPDGAAHRIVDVGSTNGLLYEGQRVQQHRLADGDVLRIGDAATGNFVTLTYRNALAMRTPQSALIARSYELDPDDPQITIGRVGCEVTLSNPQVSRFHAQIDRLPDNRRMLRDAGSTNGTFVNGQRITQHILTPGDIIQIGPFKLVYNITSLDQYDQRGALRIDARNLTRVVSRGKEKRTILADVSLSIAPREFVAVVGGSGSGKSTLIKALCGYAPASNGTVLVNGDDFYRNFDAYRTVLGYVPQEDIIHRTLPVERALTYAAQLRLPSDTAAAEIDQRIDRVLEDVEMDPHRNALVENLSGGQRKRVSIGAELLADPSLFFLDEPTSGLDPGLEKKMMYTLRRLADSGRTVVLITHATANITQCDHVIFMSNGRVVYFGPPSDALDFFGISSGDFADIYTKLEGSAEPHEPIVQRDLKDEYAHWKAAQTGSNPSTGADGSAPLLSELWEARYRRSPYYQHYVTDRLAQLPQGPVVTSHMTDTRVKAPRISPFRQFGILVRRTFDLTLQDRRNSLILLLQAPIIALLLLLVARGDALTGTLAEDVIPRGEAKKILFMLATVSVWFGIINAVREITKERPIYRRERLVNLRIGPYIFSKVVVLSVLVLIQSVILLLMLSVKLRYPDDTGLLMPSSLEIFVTVLLTSLAGMALGLGISAASSNADRAMSIVPLALIPQILFAGLIFTIEGLATPLSWLTISRWSMDALGSSVDLNNLCDLPNMANTINSGCSPGFLPADTAFANAFDHSIEHVLTRWAILFVYTIACLGITAWILKRRDRQI